MVNQAKPVLWRRILRRLATVTLTMTVVAGASAAVFFGSTQLANRAEATAVTHVADPTPVEVVALEVSDGFDIPRQFVGQVEAASSVVLSFELAGRLRDVSVSEGAEIEAGTVIARLDTSLLVAERTRLEASQSATGAQLELAETRFARAQALLADGHVSQEAVDQALATRDELASRMMEIAAAIDAVEINLEKSELRAPFAGRVGMRNVDGGETLSAGAPVLTLIETAAPEVRVGLPLSVDATAVGEVSIEIGGQTYPARLSQVRPDIDPVTRTRTVLFTLLTDDIPTFGQTATLTLTSRVEASGTWVPLDALQEGIGGSWNLLVVEDEEVRVALVEIRHADAARAYVSGTFAPGAQMIRTGAHRVVPGQAVQPIVAAE
ncbi:efflux RND transporter periplasmic adaptor subunit [Gymnodinialimonas hymeniacidonis]|uniref:efflux RND transporter periplasmic adaptor subunit n=1 Tax=Gymnodinialimonas hymeniacidonis TaxID=3126508 RepID=UPI0034C61800